MFMSASVEVVKFVACRFVSRSGFPNSVRNISLVPIRKCEEPESLNCQPRKLSKYQLGLRRRAKYVFSPDESSLGNYFVTSRHYQTKSKDFNKEDDDNPTVENKAKNVLDDLDFQSILKDFARDFEVNDETGKLLDEIKQSQPEPHDKETDQVPNKATCSDHQLDLKNDTELRAVGLPLCQHRIQESDDCDSPAVSSSDEIQEDSVDNFFHIDQELEKSVEYDVKRGETGVYDIGQLVDVLRKENLADISVIQVPQSLCYADYLVLATAKSRRHCQAIMELIVKLYKKKKCKNDPFVKFVGEKTSWNALDMGNIVLHVFLGETRDFYDIESMWLLDRKYDYVASLKSDPQLDIMQQHMNFLNTLNTQ